MQLFNIDLNRLSIPHLTKLASIVQKKIIVSGGKGDISPIFEDLKNEDLEIEIKNTDVKGTFNGNKIKKAKFFKIRDSCSIPFQKIDCQELILGIMIFYKIYVLFKGL